MISKDATVAVRSSCGRWVGTAKLAPLAQFAAFLSVLQAGHTDYVVNAAALDSMRGHGLSGQVVALLGAHPAKLFTDASAWAAYLARLGIDQLAVTPDPVQIATEGALWGAICHHGLLAEAVIVSDGTSQFRVGTHALCWVHAERLMHKLVPATPEQRRAVEVTRTPACCTEVACGTAGWADVRSLLPDLTLEAHLAFQAEPRPLSPIPATEAQGHQLGSLRRGPAPARKPHGVVHGRGAPHHLALDPFFRKEGFGRDDPWASGLPDGESQKGQ